LGSPFGATNLRLITGRGRYTDDVSPPRTTHAFVLRSPVAHAHLRRVDAAAALQMPGVLFVATGAEVQAEGLGNLACQTPLNNSDGTPRHDTPRPLLAIGKVRYVGQPVALVVAETLSQARDAAEAIEVDYEALPVVTEAKDALTPGAAQLFDHIPGNLVFDWDNDLGDPKATAAAFAKASHIVGLDLVNNRLVANSMEPRNAVADFDPQSGRSTLYTGTQGPHFVRDPLAEAVLKIPKEQLRVITPNVGGGFGMKAFVYPEQALAVWASRKIARPVKWQEDRSEGFISDNQGRDHTTHAELALDAAGRFLGLRVTTLANLGAYLSPFGAFVPTRSSDLVSGLYMIGAVHVNVKGVCTNTVPVCAYRGAGRPEAAYLLERIVDAAARELRLTPDAIRRVNFVPASAMPYTSVTKLVLDSGEFEKVMDRCMAAAEWSSFAQRRACSEREGKLRGIGMATYTERCGGGFPETASIEFKDDRVELVMGNQEYGTGLLTAYKQIVSDQLGIDADQIDVIMGDTDRTPAGLTGGARAIAVGGAALHEAGRAVISKGSQVAPTSWKLERRTSASPTACSPCRAPICASTSWPSPRPRATRRGCPQTSSLGSTPRIIACRRRRPSRMAAISSRSRSTRIPGASPSIATPSSTTSAAPSIRSCSKDRCMEASCKASVRRCSNTPSMTRTAGNCWPAHSWTTPCRAPETFPRLPSRPTMCRRHRIRSA
jgi:aerobic carbon-monoxide dehydrogenase large subunit